MKLAEALLRKCDMIEKLESLKKRIRKNARVQEGEHTPEDPWGLIEDGLSLLAEQESLICRINRANMNNRLPDGMTLMEAIARREKLLAQHKVLKGAIENTRKDHRSSRHEIKWVRLVDVVALQKRSDKLGAAIRALNTALQQANWSIELE